MQYYTRTISGINNEEGRAILNYAWEKDGRTNFVLYRNRTMLFGRIIVALHDHRLRRVDFVWPEYGPDDLREYIPAKYRGRLRRDDNPPPVFT